MGLDSFLSAGPAKTFVGRRFWVLFVPGASVWDTIQVLLVSDVKSRTFWVAGGTSPPEAVCEGFGSDPGLVLTSAVPLQEESGFSSAGCSRTSGPSETLRRGVAGAMEGRTLMTRRTDN